MRLLLLWRYPLMFAIPLMMCAIGWVIYRWGSTGHLSIDVLKLLFGYTLLIVICLFGIIVISTTVTAEANHGLDLILGMLNGLAGAFGVWAFGRNLPPSGDQK